MLDPITNDVYPNSYALEKVVEYFKTPTTEYPWTVFLINLLTIARNVYTKTGDVDKHLQAMDDESELLIQYISTCAEMYQRPAYILFYTPDYTFVPEIYRKTPTATHLKHLQLLEEAKARLSTDTLDTIRVVRQTRFITVSISGVGTSDVPVYYDLARYVSGLSSESHVLMISHMLFDYHAYKRLPNMAVMECYTGRIRYPTELGVKLTKEDIRCPFNIYTHLLYGDQCLIKGTLTTKQKKTFNPIIDRSRWDLCPDDRILKDIKILLPNISEDYFKKLNVF